MNDVIDYTKFRIVERKPDQFYIEELKDCWFLWWKWNDWKNIDYGYDRFYYNLERAKECLKKVIIDRKKR